MNFCGIFSPTVKDEKNLKISQNIVPKNIKIPFSYRDEHLQNTYILICTRTLNNLRCKAKGVVYSSRRKKRITLRKWNNLLHLKYFSTLTWKGPCKIYSSYFQTRETTKDTKEKDVNVKSFKMKMMMCGLIKCRNLV